jgi:O-antigen ligase
MKYMLFFILILGFCFYYIRRKPGFIIAYVLFFQTLNKMIFDEIGLTNFRYLSSFVFLFLIYFFHFDKVQLKINISKLIRSHIARGYFLLCVYMLIYAIHINDHYEFEFVSKFLMPGLLLFIIAAISFQKKSMYKDFFYGVIIFSIITMVTLIMYKGFGALSDRTYMEDTSNISSITQGQMSSLLSLFSILIVISTKGTIQKVGIGLVITGLIWASIAGTRGALVSIVVTILVYLFFTGHKRMVIIYLVLTSIIITPILLYSGITDSLLFIRTSELLEPGAIQNMKRFYRWILFFKYLPDNYVFGLGPGGWGKHVMIGEYRYPHNIIIEFILMYGIVGMISFFSIFSTSIKEVISNIRDKSCSMHIKGIMLAWVFFTTNAMFSGSFVRGNADFFTYSAILVSVGYRKFNFQKK